MRRIHFDANGPVWHHYFFWQPWGCLGCLGRGIGFMVLLFIFLFLLSQFRSCNSQGQPGNHIPAPADTVAVDEPLQPGVPPIDERDVIEDDGRRLVANRLNVIFGAETGERDHEQWRQQFKSLYPGDEYKIIFYDPLTKLMALEVPADQRTAMLEALPEQIPDIPFMVFEENVMTGEARPNDPDFASADKAWCFDQIGSFGAWEMTRGSSDVIVAVVDSYFDLNGEEFARANIVSPYSVANGNSQVGLPDSYNSSRPDPVMAHGTNVSYLIFGALDNGKAAGGMAPECSFMPVSLGQRFGSLGLLQGLLYSINKGAKVVNISAGIAFTEDVQQLSDDEQIELAHRLMPDQEEVWKYVFDMARKFYVTIVWAAGNENIFTALDASKRGSETIKVSAVDRTASKALFSNYGNFPDRQIFESTVSAPGAQVYGMFPGGRVAPIDGTSFSAPIVAGAVSLMKSLDMSLTTERIAEILKTTGRPLPVDSKIGPLLQVDAALAAVTAAFLPFDSLKYMIAEGRAATIPASLLRPLDVEDSDNPSALPPMIGLTFELTGSNAGKLTYVNTFDPAASWTGDFRVQADGDGFLFVQEADARSEVATEIPFAPARFTVRSDENGNAKIVNVDSRSVRNIPFYLKKS